MNSKKGAIELSMTTIIVIIMGVTLLSLGLLWVRSTFSKIGGTTSDAFEQADAAIGEIFLDADSSLVISPPQVSVGQGGADNIKIIITNDQPEDTQFVAVVKSLDPDFLNCVFTDTKSEKSKPYNLPSGKQAEFGLIVEVKSNAKIGTLLICDVDVTGITGDSSEQLSVKVGKQKGLFG